MHSLAGRQVRHTWRTWGCSPYSATASRSVDALIW